MSQSNSHRVILVLALGVVLVAAGAQAQKAPRYGSGCYDCGGWSTGQAAAAGAAVGLVAGAAIGSASANAASTNAYSAGYAAGAAGTTYPMGAIYATLPAGCSSATVGGTTYYLYGNTWFKPSYGANGVYYRVVPTP